MDGRYYRYYGFLVGSIASVLLVATVLLSLLCYTPQVAQLVPGAGEQLYSYCTFRVLYGTISVPRMVIL